MSARLFVVLAVFVAFIIVREYRIRQRQTGYFDALDLFDAVHDLAVVMEKLENADRLAVDLSSCKPGLLHRFFRASWMSSDGRNRTIDLCATGRGRATRGLIVAAHDERDRLNQEAIDRIRALACALDTGDSSQATVFEPLPDGEQADDTDAGRSEQNGEQNVMQRSSWWRASR